MDERIFADAVELPPDAGTAWRMMNPSWPKRTDAGHGWMTPRNARQAGLSEGKIRKPFWPCVEAGENVSRGSVCPGFHERSADSSDAKPGHAGICGPARLDHCFAGPQVNSGAANREARAKVLEAARRELEHPGAHSGWLGPGLAERQKVGSADDGRAPSCRDTETAPCGRQQIRSRPAVTDRRTSVRRILGAKS